jgi:hypothetical protein
MLNNFTLQDIFGAALACALFALIFVAPGYVLGWLLDLFDFTRRTSAVRFVIAIVLSVAVSPIILFLVYHFTSAKTTILFLLLIGIVFSIILLKSKYASLPEEATSFYRTALLVAVGWIIFAILFIVDIQWGDRLYYNVISYDFTTRVAIVNAITRSGVPPINPSYYPGHPVRLTFLYYFWYIPCSLAAQIGSPFVSGYTAMIASVAWCGLALMATIALYLRLRNPAGGSSSTWKSSLLGIGLLLVSGLDVIPALLLIISSRVRYGYTFLNGDIEHWNEQITAWIGSVAWVPHHVAALIACLAALMLIHSVRGRRTSQQIKAGVIAGLAFASAVGLSVYVTLVFVLFWGIWMIVLFFQKERLLSLIMGLAGIIALIAASPFLAGLVGGNNSGLSGEIPMAFSVRMFLPVYIFISTYPPVLLNLIYLLALPINYLMELGFFLIAGILWIQQRRERDLIQNPFHLSEIILLGITVFIGSFIRSTSIGNNDLGWRAWLVGQFILLVWGVDVINWFFPHALEKTKQNSNPPKRISRQLRIFLILGLLTTITDVLLLRTWPMLVDAGIAGFPSGLSPDNQLGKRTFAAKQAYDFINVHTPQNVLIQDNPDDPSNRPIGLYANRPIAISGQTAYGVPMQDFNNRALSISRIYDGSSSWAEIDPICAANSIDIIVMTDIDPIWKNLSSLEQERKPLYQNDYYAVFMCGN